MKINKNPLSIRRPMAIAVAVSAACQIAYADSPFASEPLHLIDKSMTISQSTVKPRVMLFVDDSGSMRSVTNGRTRIAVVRDALNKIVDKYHDNTNNTDQIFWNLMSLWGTEKGRGPYYKGFYDNKTPASYTYMGGTEIKKYINSLTDSGRTPTTMRYVQAALYAREAIKYRCQKNFIVMLSDGDANEDGPWFYGDVRPYDPEGIFKNDFPYRGFEPYRNWEGDGVSFFSKILYETDLKTAGLDKENEPWDGKQNIMTFAVGFGNGLTTQGRQYLEKAGRADPGMQTYFNAGTPDELVQAFDQIFSSIDQASGSGSSQTTSVSTPSNASSSLANMAATMTLDTGIWSSEIKFNKLDSDGNPEKTLGGDPVAYPAKYIGRKVLVNNGQDVYWLNYHDVTLTSFSVFKDFGFPVTPKGAREEFLDGFMPWYLRDPNESDEQIEKNVAKLKLSQRTVSKYRKRTDDPRSPARQMGDVLDASTVAIGDGAEYVVTGANDGMVYIFKSTGVLTEPYALQLNYVPVGMERESTTDTLGVNLKKLAENGYGRGIPHIYGVNGGMSYTKTAKTGNRQQRTVVLGAMGQGARGIYALNISGCERNLQGRSCVPVGLDAPQSNWKNSVPLWENEKGNGNLLGYTVGTPILYQLALNWNTTTGSSVPAVDQNVILAGFVSNGYPAANTSLPYDQKPTLYVYNVLGEEMGTNATIGVTSVGHAGEIVGKIPADSADGAGALASPVVVDVDFDGVADVAYAGDYFGDLYRFDLRGDPTQWTAVKIYDGKSSQPITAAPAVYRSDKDNFIVTFGTGSNLYESDLTNQNRQGFFGIYDDLTNRSPSAVTVNDLLKQQLTKTGDKRTITDIQLDSSKRGWWFDLDEGTASVQGNTKKSSSSEQVVVQPQMLLSTVFFTTRIYGNESSSSGSGSAVNPNVESCKISNTTSEKSTGTSWMMGVDVRNGGKTKTAKFRDRNDPNKADDSAGYDIGVLASQPKIIGGDLDKESDALDPNAQVGDGEQLTLTKGGVPAIEPRNDCLTSDNYHSEVSQASLKDPLNTFGLTGPLCEQSGRLIRINTREIK